MLRVIAGVTLVLVLAATCQAQPALRYWNKAMPSAANGNSVSSTPIYQTSVNNLLVTVQQYTSNNGYTAILTQNPTTGAAVNYFQYNTTYKQFLLTSNGFVVMVTDSNSGSNQYDNFVTAIAYNVATGALAYNYTWFFPIALSCYVTNTYSSGYNALVNTSTGENLFLGIYCNDGSYRARLISTATWTNPIVTNGTNCNAARWAFSATSAFVSCRDNNYNSLIAQLSLADLSTTRAAQKVATGCGASVLRLVAWGGMLASYEYSNNAILCFYTVADGFNTTTPVSVSNGIYGVVPFQNTTGWFVAVFNGAGSYRVGVTIYSAANSAQSWSYNSNWGRYLTPLSQVSLWGNPNWYVLTYSTQGTDNYYGALFMDLNGVAAMINVNTYQLSNADPTSNSVASIVVAPGARVIAETSSYSAYLGCSILQANGSVTPVWRARAYNNIQASALVTINNDLAYIRVDDTGLPQQMALSVNSAGASVWSNTLTTVCSSSSVTTVSAGSNVVLILGTNFQVNDALTGGNLWNVTLPNCQSSSTTGAYNAFANSVYVSDYNKNLVYIVNLNTRATFFMTSSNGMVVDGAFGFFVDPFQDGAAAVDSSSNLYYFQPGTAGAVKVLSYSSSTSFKRYTGVAYEASSLFIFDTNCNIWGFGKTGSLAGNLVANAGFGPLKQADADYCTALVSNGAGSLWETVGVSTSGSTGNYARRIGSTSGIQTVNTKISATYGGFPTACAAIVAGNLYGTCISQSNPFPTRMVDMDLLSMNRIVQTFNDAFTSGAYTPYGGIYILANSSYVGALAVTNGSWTWTRPDYKGCTVMKINMGVVTLFCSSTNGAAITLNEAQGFYYLNAYTGADWYSVTGYSQQTWQSNYTAVVSTSSQVQGGYPYGGLAMTNQLYSWATMPPSVNGGAAAGSATTAAPAAEDKKIIYIAAGIAVVIIILVVAFLVLKNRGSSTTGADTQSMNSDYQQNKV